MIFTPWAATYMAYKWLCRGWYSCYFVLGPWSIHELSVAVYCLTAHLFPWYSLARIWYSSYDTYRNNSATHSCLSTTLYLNNSLLVPQVLKILLLSVFNNNTPQLEAGRFSVLISVGLHFTSLIGFYFLPCLTWSDSMADFDIFVT